MKSFIIKELNKDMELVSFSFNEEGFHYHIKKENSLKVKEILIVSPNIITSLITYNFNKHYKKILGLYLSASSDDSNDSNTYLMMALDEGARLKSILIRKYHHLLKKKEEANMLKKLDLLDTKIKERIVDLKLQEEEKLEYVEEKSHSR